jgi:hypothetical protein
MGDNTQRFALVTPRIVSGVNRSGLLMPGVLRPWLIPANVFPNRSGAISCNGGSSAASGDLAGPQLASLPGGLLFSVNCLDGHDGG